MIFPLSVVCYMDDYFRFNDSLVGGRWQLSQSHRYIMSKFRRTVTQGSALRSGLAVADLVEAMVKDNNPCISAALLLCSWPNGSSGITHEAVCIYEQLLFTFTWFTFPLKTLYGIKKAKVQKTSGISQSVKPILVVTGIYPSHTHTRAHVRTHTRSHGVTSE